MSNVRAVYEGFVGHEGVPVLLHEGDEYDADHPLVVARPELFTDPPARRVLSKPKAEARSKPPTGKDVDG